jgi:hypothetical protein
VKNYLFHKRTPNKFWNYLANLRNWSIFFNGGILLPPIDTGTPMSFKKFSTTHNAPVKGKPASDGKSAPLVDQPPAPPSKSPTEAKPNGKA